MARRRGASVFRICGFSAMTQARKRFGAASMLGSSFTPCLDIALSCGDGCVSTTTTGPSPRAIQPLSSAPPILPAPIRRMGAAGITPAPGTPARRPRRLLRRSCRPRARTGTRGSNTRRLQPRGSASPRTAARWRSPGPRSPTRPAFLPAFSNSLIAMTYQGGLADVANR